MENFVKANNCTDGSCPMKNEKAKLDVQIETLTKEKADLENKLRTAHAEIVYLKEDLTFANKRIHTMEEQFLRHRKAALVIAEDIALNS